MQRAACQFGLQQVRRIHGAIGTAGADKGVHFVDEQDHLAFCGFDFLQHGLKAFLEFAAVFGAGDKRAEIERENALVLQRFRHVTTRDAQGESFDDGGLADARLADQHRVIFRAAGKHLDGAADFLVTADDRIEFLRARLLGDVLGVFFQRIETGFRVRAGDFPALAYLGECAFQRLRVRAGAAQRPAGRGVAGGKRGEHAVLRYVFIAGGRRGLLGGIERAHPVRG